MTTENSGGGAVNQLRSLELLWGNSERPRRGPKPRLSIDRIVATAIEIADAEGLEALSMQRISGDLGYTTMSLYRYVPSKAQLLDVMIDRVVGQPPVVSEASPSDWRAQVEGIAWGMWQVFIRHRWLTSVTFTSPPIGPNHLAWMEVGTSAFTNVGLSDDEAFASFAFLQSAVRDWARLEIDTGLGDLDSETTGEGERSGAQSERAYATALWTYAAPENYPTLARLVSEGMFDPLEQPGAGDDAAGSTDMDLGRASFAFAIGFPLHLFLDGIERYVAAKHA